jgi:N-acetylmuramoyl-L-alanine amidase
MFLNKRRYIFFVGIPSLVVVSFLAMLINQTSTYVIQHTPLDLGSTIIIDPGHGYPDGGTTSCTGVLEADLNLEISLRLYDLFRFFGARTVLTRQTGDSVYTEGNSIAKKKISDTRNRVDFINNYQNAVVISIHQNHFYESRYSGAQVFYAHTSESDRLATEMQNALIKGLDTSNSRKAKKASGVYLMEHIKHPAVLIECGFLSNSREEGLLRSSAYQKQLCGAIATGYMQYLNNHQVS